VKFPSLTIRVRTGGFEGDDVRYVPGEGLRDRGGGSSASEEDEECMEDAGEEERGESSESSGWKGL
jgi:hypothetical protein